MRGSGYPTDRNLCDRPYFFIIIIIIERDFKNVKNAFHTHYLG